MEAKTQTLDTPLISPAAAGSYLKKFGITIIVLDVDAVDENRCSRIRLMVIRVYRLSLFADNKAPFIPLTCNI
jgi:hypothetical protein